MATARRLELMKSHRLILLPGFLGEARDFQPLIEELKKLPQNPASSLEIDCLDWIDEASHLLEEDLESVGASLWEEIEARSQPHEQLWILGYSLGGRLALSLWRYLRESQKRPDVFFFFVSTNPGLTHRDEIDARWKNDCLWSGRFRSEEWGRLMLDWNAQGVFAGSKSEPERSRRKSQRDLLAKCLVQWSLAKQPSYREELTEAGDYLWITGALDTKFTKLAEGLKNTKTITSASHRVHMDAPRELAMMVLDQLRTDSSVQK